MTARILDGAALARSLRAETAARALELRSRLGRPPGLAVILVGNDPASSVYVRSKRRACEEIGIASFGYELPATTSQEQLLQLVDSLNRDPTVDGILVQLPLPPQLSAQEVLAAVDPAKDVDGFHPINVGRLWNDEPGFVPCTPRGVMVLLERSGLSLSGKRAVVVGRSNIVGKPMAALLLRAHATVTIAHSRTAELASVCREADLVVAAVGRPGLLGLEAVRPGATVVDVGINRLTDPALGKKLLGSNAQRWARFEAEGKALVGDVDFEAVAPIAGAITPVPGGVGPLTVAMLLENTLDAALHRLATPDHRGNG